MTSSWSVPPAVWPLAASTPMILNGTLRSWICWPTGSDPGEEVVGHGLADHAPPCGWRAHVARSKNAPEATSQSRMVW